MTTYQKFLDVATFLAAVGTVLTILSFIVRLFRYRRTSVNPVQHSGRKRFANSPKRAGVSFVFAVVFYAALVGIQLTTQKSQHFTLRGNLAVLSGGLIVLLIVTGAFWVVAIWPTIVTAVLRNQWIWASILLLCTFTVIFMPMAVVVFYTWSPAAEPVFAAVT